LKIPRRYQEKGLKDDTTYRYISFLERKQLPRSKIAVEKAYLKKIKGEMKNMMECEHRCKVEEVTRGNGGISLVTIYGAAPAS